MLPPFIIEQIRQREERERARQERSRPRLELPVENLPLDELDELPAQPAGETEDERAPDDGIVIVDLTS